MNKEIKTYKGIENLVVQYLFRNESFEAIEDLGLIELIDDNIYNNISNFAIKKYDITDKEYKTLKNKNYGFYSFCKNKNEVITNILIDTIQYNLTINHKKMTFNKMLKEKILSL